MLNAVVRSRAKERSGDPWQQARFGNARASPWHPACGRAVLAATSHRLSDTEQSEIASIDPVHNRDEYAAACCHVVLCVKTSDRDFDERGA